MASSIRPVTCVSSRLRWTTGMAIKPAYGYRIEYQGRVAVISGDTRYNANVVRYGEGADFLVHEVAMARPELLVEAYIQRIVNHHSSPQEAKGSRKRGRNSPRSRISSCSPAKT